jgi:glycerophosphoryl diester phosphodiesterase
MGADMIEFDVRRTADGHLVIHHDRDLEGRPIGSLTLAQLRALPHGSDVPTLAETLDSTRGKIGLDVELKEEGYEAAVVDEVHARFGREDVAFTSFSVRSVATLARLPGTPRAGLILDRNTDNEIDLWREWIADHGREPTADDLVATTARTGAAVIAASLELMDTSGFGSAARAAGLALFVWTVNDAVAIERYVADPDIEAIITDRPDLALAIRARS